jgi:hypothetical protein
MVKIGCKSLIEVFITQRRKLHISNEIFSLKSDFFADLEEERQIWPKW